MCLFGICGGDGAEVYGQKEAALKYALKRVNSETDSGPSNRPARIISEFFYEEVRILNIFEGSQ